VFRKKVHVLVFYPLLLYGTLMHLFSVSQQDKQTCSGAHPALHLMDTRVSLMEGG